jgi:hypothetical protein
VLAAPARATEIMATTYVAREASVQGCKQSATAALLAMHADSVVTRDPAAVYAGSAEYALGIDCSVRGSMTVVAAGPQLAGVRSVLAHFEFVFHGHKVGPRLPKPKTDPRI